MTDNTHLYDEPRRIQAAYDTLTKMGYTWTGGVEWRPPLGTSPDFHDGGEIPNPPKKDPVVERVEELAIHFAKTAARVLQDAVTPVTTITINPEMVGNPELTKHLAEALRKSKSFISGGVAGEPYPRPAGEHVARDGFEYAFYKLVELLDLGAQPRSPSDVFENQMYPMIKQALEAEKSVAAEPLFRMQHGPHLPWRYAEILYAGYAAVYGTGQSIQRMNERGGFGWGEMSSAGKTRPIIMRAMAEKAKELGIPFSQ